MSGVSCEIYGLDPCLLAGQNEWASWLSTEEQARLSRFRVESPRLEYLAARLLARAVLSHRLGLPPQAVPLAISPYGKPHLPAHDCYLSLSHTQGYAVLALCAAHPVGVDVERWDRKVRPALASRFFSPSECAQLEALGETPARDRYFLQLWTAKEAWWKASDPKPGFDMTQLTLKASPWRLLDPLGAPQGSLHLIEEPEHLLALASTTAGRLLAPTIHRWTARDLQRALE